MIIKEHKNYKKHLLLLIFILIITSHTACDGKVPDSGSGKVRVIKSHCSVSDEGIIYEDDNGKCYYDFSSGGNAYFCFRPNCDHYNVDCVARANHPYTFLIGNDQYYIKTGSLTDKDSKVRIISYLYKSDVSHSDVKCVVEFEGINLSDGFLIGDTLYLLILKPDIVDGVATNYGRYDMYRINMKNYSVKKTHVKEGDNIGYILFGCIDNKLIMYYRYMDKEIDPADYGKTGDMASFMEDTENYRRYMEDVMEVFHEGMCYYDIKTHKIVDIDLPVFTFLYKDSYYYNKKIGEGLYQLVAYNFATGEETLIFNGPVSSIDAVGDMLFIKEGKEAIGQLTFTPVITFDKATCGEYAYNLATGELNKVVNNSPEKAEFELIEERDGYYIFLYSNLSEGIHRRVGYMLKEDFINGREKITLVDPL
jgi:hypothetical protein